MGALIFYFSTGIQICIAMSDINSSNFPTILNEIIEKSHFTQRQIEIILKKKDLSDVEFSITKGAYYRQVSQSREKLAGVYYSLVVLRVLGILLPDDIDVISKLSEQVSVIKDSDVFPERERDVMSLIDRVVKQAVGM